MTVVDPEQDTRRLPAQEAVLSEESPLLSAEGERQLQDSEDISVKKTKTVVAIISILLIGEFDAVDQTLF